MPRTTASPDFFSLDNLKPLELWCTEGLASALSYKLSNRDNFLDWPEFRVAVRYCDQQLVISGSAIRDYYLTDIDKTLAALLKSRLGPEHPLCRLPIIKSSDTVSLSSGSHRFVASACRLKNHPDRVSVHYRSRQHIGTYIVNSDRLGAAWSCYIAETLVTLKFCNRCSVTAIKEPGGYTYRVIGIESDTPVPQALKREICSWRPAQGEINESLQLRQLSLLRAVETHRPAGLPDLGPDLAHRPFFRDSRSIGKRRKKTALPPIPLQDTLEEILFGIRFNLGLRRLNGVPFAREDEYRQQIGTELPRWMHLLSTPTADLIIELALERRKPLPDYPSIDHHVAGWERLLNLSGEAQKDAVKRVLFSQFVHRLVLAEETPELVTKPECKEVAQLPHDYQNLFGKKPPVWVQGKFLISTLLKFAVETGYEIPDEPPILLKTDEDFIGQTTRSLDF